MEPARRAASISPVAALRARAEAAASVRSHTSWLIAIVGAVGVLAAILLPAASGTGPLPVRALVVYLVLLFAVLVTPALLGPLGRIAGLPFAGLFRLEERLARAAIARDRARTTITVGALVVGLAMVVALGAVATNARAAATAWLEDVVPGDEILTAIAPAPVGDEGVRARGRRDRRRRRGRRRSPRSTSPTPGPGSTRPPIRGADVAADGRLTFTAATGRPRWRRSTHGGAVILPRIAGRAAWAWASATCIAASTAGGSCRAHGGRHRGAVLPGRSGEAVLVGWPDALGPVRRRRRRRVRRALRPARSADGRRVGRGRRARRPARPDRRTDLARRGRGRRRARPGVRAARPAGAGRGRRRGAWASSTRSRWTPGSASASSACSGRPG